MPVTSQDDKEKIVRTIVDATDGFSGARITALCDKAKLVAIESADDGKPAQLAFAHLERVLEGMSKGEDPSLAKA